MSDITDREDHLAERRKGRVARALPPAERPVFARTVTIGAVTVMTAMLVWRGFGDGLGEVARWATWVGLALLAFGAAPRSGLREAYLASLCVAVTLAALVLTPDPTAAIARGLDQAAFLAAFILLLTLLFETAITSPAVAACGEHIARQPGGRRHAALFWGTDVMAVLFNLGIVSLLSPLVRRGLPDEGAAVRADMERRQLSAILRGFAWCVVWSPTALAPLALFELMDGIDRTRWSILGLTLAALVFALSWGEDLWRARRHPEWESHEAVPPTPWRAYGRFALATAALLTLAVGLDIASGEGLVFGLMAACPIMMFGWLALQSGAPRPGFAGETVDKVSALIAQRLPGVGPVALTLACSGYLGRVAASLIPAEAVERFVEAVALPQWAWLALVPVVITALAFLAVSPIMLAVFFGALFGGLTTLPADPTLLALAISCGWAVTMTASPFATVVLLMAKQNDVSGARLTLAWNGAFSAATLAVIAAFFYVATGGA